MLFITHSLSLTTGLFLIADVPVAYAFGMASRIDAD